MTWTGTEGSKIFRQFVADQLINASGTGWVGLDGTTTKVALYGNTGTPTKDAASNAYSYNTGQWVTGNEVTGASEWVAGGRTLTWSAVDVTVSGTIKQDASDLTGSATVTMSGIYGCLVYADAVSASPVDPGVCFNYFGGTTGVTSGTYSVLWNASGVFSFSV